jgi:hypothetical protein
MKQIKKIATSIVLLLTTVHVSAQQAQCSNGKTYKLDRSFVEVDGKFEQAYEYEGPLGSGFVLSSVDEATAKKHVCKEDNQNRWLENAGRDD